MPTANEPVCAWATDCRDKYPENHDSGYAGRICMADGNLAWTAVIADGAGGSMEGLKVSALAIQAFVDAVRRSSLPELSDPAARDAWLRGWTKTLHADAFARFKGGMATFCGAVILPPAADGADWKLFTLNVGDSQAWKLTGDGKCMGVTPDAPPNNANVEGHNPIRVVGVAPKGDFCLMDVEEFPLPKEGPCWILAGSDGFFSKKKGKDELSIFSTGDLRDLCLDPGVPFQELPARAIRRSLANAQKLGCAEMMDNATVAMLGFRVPATNLAAPASATSAPSALPPRQPAPPAPAGTAGGARRPAVGGGGRPKDAGAAVRRLAAIGVAGLVLGFLIGLLSGRRPPETVSEPRVAVAETSFDTKGLPSHGRCRACMARYLDKSDTTVTELVQTFHWEGDPACPSRAPEASSVRR